MEATALNNVATIVRNDSKGKRTYKSNFGTPITNLENEIFDVAVEDVILPEGFSFIDTPFRTVLDIKNNRVLGVVKKGYNPLQQSTMVDLFLKGIKPLNIKDDGVTYSYDKNGRQFRLRAKLEDITFRNAIGVNDQTEIYLNLQTGYDGGTSTKIFLETFRLICSNGMKVNTTEYSVNFKNTINNLTQIETAIENIKVVNDYRLGLLEKYEYLNNQVVDDKSIKTFLATLDPSKYSKEALEQSTESLDLIMSVIDEEFETTGKTSFGLFNGITRFNNHYNKSVVGKNTTTQQGFKQKSTARNIDSLLFGQANLTNNKALELLLAK